ncbi:MAG: TrkH family potassium uptake protein [Eubacteriales bacterium]
MSEFIKRQSPARIIAFGFAFVILLGSLLLVLPCSVKDGVNLSYIDALYTSTSAVCVTGLVTVDIADTFTPLGQFFVAMLIQIGGLGVTSVGAGLILLVRRKMDLKGRNLIKEAMNLDSGKGVVRFIRDVFAATLAFELAGAALSFTVFIRDYPFPKALGLSLFHSVATFNNSGFDIFGNMQSLSAYKDNVMLNIVTMFLIFFGGIGFLVIKELWSKKFNFKKLSMHAKVVLSVSGVLIVLGTLLIKLTEGNNITWLGAIFTSFSSRTAGFATFSLDGFSKAGLLAVMIFMFIGASPGSTGGGIKTTTFFVIFKGIFSAATNKNEKAFRYAIPTDAFTKAAVIAFLALSAILGSSLLISIFEPGMSLTSILFEMTSAFATVGLSTGITPLLSTGSKIVSIFMMYMGRLGPLTIASMWYFSRGENIRFPEGNIAIG